MKVKVYSYRKGDFVLSCTWSLDGQGKVVCDSESNYRRLEEDGAPGYGKIYYPKDGEDFLRALPVAIRGTYCYAKLEED